MIRKETVIRRNPRAVHRELAEGDGVLLNLETGAYYRLNRVGLIIWNILEADSTLPELLGELRAGLPDAPPELDRDVVDFLEDLGRRDILRVSEGGDRG